MNGLGVTILVIMLLVSWWQWVEKDRYRELYEDSLIKKPKKIAKTKAEEESLGIEYDDKIPHPYK